jgi:hypothetical protein
MSRRRLRASRDTTDRREPASALQVMTPDPTVLKAVRRIANGDLRCVEWLTPERAVVHNDRTWRRS